MFGDGPHLDPAGFFALVRNILQESVPDQGLVEYHTYSFSGRMIDSLDSRTCDLFAICSLPLPKSIVHQTNSGQQKSIVVPSLGVPVSQSNRILRFCENHFDGCASMGVFFGSAVTKYLLQVERGCGFRRV